MRDYSRTESMVDTREEHDRAHAALRTLLDYYDDSWTLAMVMGDLSLALKKIEAKALATTALQWEADHKPKEA